MKSGRVGQVFSAECVIQQTKIVYKEARARMDPDPLNKVPLPLHQGPLLPQLLLSPEGWFNCPYDSYLSTNVTSLLLVALQDPDCVTYHKRTHVLWVFLSIDRSLPLPKGLLNF
jgi:hypothetical protein